MSIGKLRGTVTSTVVRVEAAETAVVEREDTKVVADVERAIAENRSAKIEADAGRIELQRTGETVRAGAISGTAELFENTLADADQIPAG